MHPTKVIHEQMKLAIDVGYHLHGATAAGVLFRDWKDREPAEEITVFIEDVEPYESGRFYKRELPCILELLDKIEQELEVIIIDGFVWLANDSATAQPGLGAFLFEQLGKKVAVIGVAKTEFIGSGASELLRGNSRRPLFVSAAGIDLGQAVQGIKQMHGEHRIPTLLKRVDQLSRV